MTDTTFQDIFSEEIWNSTYKDHNDKTIDDTFRRVAKAISSVEETEDLRKEWEDKFYDMLTNFKGVPGGRILSNAGTEWNGTTLMNCFVGPRAKTDVDSLQSILYHLESQSKTLKSEGGWGENFSYIRPRGAFIHGIGVETPGAVKYMELFDKTSEIITSGSGKKTEEKRAKGKIRKGAQMAVLDIFHPDIIEFITAKQQPGKLTKFNVSVNVSNEFMEQLKSVLLLEKELDLKLKQFDESSEYIQSLKQEIQEKDNWDLIFPDTTHSQYKKIWNGDIKLWKEKGYPIKVYNTVSVKWLWNLIMESTYNRAEPGVLFLDRANYYNPLYYGETIFATNPCVTGDTLIAVADGRNVVPIKQLVEEKKSVFVYSTNIETGKIEIKKAHNPRKTGSNSKVYKVTLDDGSSFKATPNHKVLLDNRTYTEVINLKNGDLVSTFYGYNFNLDNYDQKNDQASKKIISVEFFGEEDVYNITVDDNHNYNIVTLINDNVLSSSGLCVKNCGEQTLSPGNICCLGTINLTQFVNQTRDGFIFNKIKKYVRYMVRFLDNVNSYSSAPLSEYVDSMRKKRRIGLGVMGWGSALIMMKIRFASSEANKIRDELMSVIARTAYETSIDLAIEKGKFEYCNPELHFSGPFIAQLNLSEDYLNKLKTTGIRNASLLSQQPNGTTSIFANITSGGIEPIFMTEYIRTTIVPFIPDNMLDITPKFYEGEWKETKVFKFAKEGTDEILKGKFNNVVYKIDKNRGLTKEVLCEDYGVRFLKSINEWNPKSTWNSTTDQISAEEHISDLKGFSKYTDSACSKTINIPNNYSFENFKNIYLDAYETGYIKGITTYRAGTMASVLSAKDEKLASNNDEEIIVDEVKMPSSSPAVVKILNAEGRKWYLTVVNSENSERPYALFVHTNSPEKGITTNDAVERLIALARKKKIKEQYILDLEIKLQNENNVSKITRTLSLLLRHGVLIKNIVYELNKVEGVFVTSFLFQITKFLSQYIKDGTKVDEAVCQNCQSVNVIFSEGCYKCVNCGSSKC